MITLTQLYRLYSRSPVIHTLYDFSHFLYIVGSSIIIYNETPHILTRSGTENKSLPGVFKRSRSPEPLSRYTQRPDRLITKSTVNGNCKIPHRRSKFGQSALSIAGCQIYTLTSGIKLIPGVKSFPTKANQMLAKSRPRAGPFLSNCVLLTKTFFIGLFFVYFYTMHCMCIGVLCYLYFHICSVL